VLNRIRAIEAESVVEELSYISPQLSTISKHIPYNVPVGYFDGLASQVLNRIKAIESANAAEELGYLSTLLSKVSKQMPYDVPAGYFEGLAEKAMQSVRESADIQTAKEELETLSPLLGGLKKQMPYSVPQGYFENLTEKIVAEENKPAVKVISITSRKWFRYAAAAMVIGVIATLGLTLFSKKDTVDPGTNSHAWVEKKLKKVSTEKIEEFIQLTDEEKSIKESLVSVDNKTPEVKDLIKDIPEKEIQSLLNDTQLLDDANTDAADETMMN
jgi:hypothetical protein